VLSAAELDARIAADLPALLSHVDHVTLGDLEQIIARHLFTLAESNPSIRALIVERGLLVDAPDESNPSIQAWLVERGLLIEAPDDDRPDDAA
jgi:hypothetical protein